MNKLKNIIGKQAPYCVDLMKDIVAIPLVLEHMKNKILMVIEFLKDLEVNHQVLVFNRELTDLMVDISILVKDLISLEALEYAKELGGQNKLYDENLKYIDTFINLSRDTKNKIEIIKEDVSNLFCEIEQYVDGLSDSDVIEGVPIKIKFHKNRGEKEGLSREYNKGNCNKINSVLHYVKECNYKLLNHYVDENSVNSEKAMNVLHIKNHNGNLKTVFGSEGGVYAIHIADGLIPIEELTYNNIDSIKDHYKITKIYSGIVANKKLEEVLSINLDYSSVEKHHLDFTEEDTRIIREFLHKYGFCNVANSMQDILKMVNKLVEEKDYRLINLRLLLSLKNIFSNYGKRYLLKLLNKIAYKKEDYNENLDKNDQIKNLIIDKLKLRELLKETVETKDNGIQMHNIQLNLSLIKNSKEEFISLPLFEYGKHNLNYYLSLISNDKKYKEGFMINKLLSLFENFKDKLGFYHCYNIEFVDDSGNNMDHEFNLNKVLKAANKYNNYVNIDQFYKRKEFVLQYLINNNILEVNKGEILIKGNLNFLYNSQILKHIRICINFIRINKGENIKKGALSKRHLVEFLDIYYGVGNYNLLN